MVKKSEDLEFPIPPSVSKETVFEKKAVPQKMIMADLQDEFRKITEATPRDIPSEQAFITSKMHMISTHPTLQPKQREAILLSLLDNQPPEIRSIQLENRKGPIPGGVGYGMFYNTALKNDFAAGTAIYCEIICPNPPGGNVNTWLYLTATNRSAKGVEAFVSYNGQNQAYFKVFDWARQDHWQTNIPFSQLGNYLWPRSAHGHSFQTIFMMNITQQGSQNHWWNQVLIWNRISSSWDLIYQYGYSATLTEQTTGWVGSWGPIVETFQNPYKGTNLMGFLSTQLISRSGDWGHWKLLNAQDSYVRTDNNGFYLIFLDPNYNWAVNS